LFKSVKGKPPKKKKTSQKMDPCIALCYYYILTKKNPVYKKGRDENTFSVQGEVQGK
jgi:hypothetical protein